jgi:hypothetical protein
MNNNEFEQNKANADTVVKKRGRKPKKDMKIISQDLGENNLVINNGNINVLIEESVKNEEENEINCLEFDENQIENENLILKEDSKNPIKKRGRKPKGGKIIQQIVSLNNNKEVKPNIILHLKCSLKDINSNLLNSDIEPFHFSSNKNNLSYEIINSNNNVNNNNDKNNYSISNLENSENNVDTFVEDEYEYDTINTKNKDNDVKEVWKKLKMLEHNLHINNINDKKSACFWCTYEFDNPPIYIPKHFIKDSYHVYGCFCSPECATAYLMEENIDSSSKFERYHLINHVYSKIYDYKKNIKPAPNPYYMLEKYYGNLNIQEYRALLKNERLFLVVDKPLTRILPELHEDNDDFIINNKIIPCNTYQVKKNLKKKQTKNNILNEKFGLNQ